MKDATIKIDKKAHERLAIAVAVDKKRPTIRKVMTEAADKYADRILKSKGVKA